MAVTATYNGSYTKGYLQYVDLGGNGHTLVAVPGNSYFLTLASGWAGLLATPPADGLWSGGAFFAVPLSGIPGFASPGAFILGSPGTVRPADPVMHAVLRARAAAEAQRLERARQERLAEEIVEARLTRAGWTGEELALRRDGWAEGDIRRRRRRLRLLELRGQSR